MAVIRNLTKIVCCILFLAAGLAVGPAVDHSRTAQAATTAGDANRRVLELVNEARSQARRCGWRRHAAAPPLAASGMLAGAGYRWRVTGDNIASGQPTAEIVVAGWLRSPRHCANIMDPDFTELGVGHAVEPRAVRLPQASHVLSRIPVAGDPPALGSPASAPRAGIRSFT